MFFINFHGYLLMPDRSRSMMIVIWIKVFVLVSQLLRTVPFIMDSSLRLFVIA